GVFPWDVEAIRQLPGIGRSTAAAIAVFAYGQQCAILDGNVKRIFARYFGIDGYTGGKKNEILLWQKAEELLPDRDESNARNGIEVYTQALMDLGATICTRGKPKCASCPLLRDCIAFRDNLIDKLPAPRPRKPLPKRETVLLMLMKQGRIFLEKRPVVGIWGNLWCLPEMPMSEDAGEHCRQRYGMIVEPLAQMQSLDHTFTHFKLRIHPQPLQVVSCPSAVTPDGSDNWATFDDALKAAIPSPVRKLLIQYGCP
ncbi:MAG: NUDIX domain-containing protein, partial [Nitrosospira sp.]